MNRRQFIERLDLNDFDDDDDEITDVVARWPGSTHDSRIMTNSGIQTVLERGLPGNGDTYLLGDSGYGCKKWLLTPYNRPVDQHQASYNRTTKYYKRSNVPAAVKPSLDSNHTRTFPEYIYDLFCEEV
ncbi:ALPL-like protein [Mya arenaria]|uniref:ALPL-like protein n=1 Tax=Mya arenaria TaxID=6604 RepID=A0ABY7EVL0_MYAAR|nr:ALPL-like protein [Mya arenaria]